MRCRAAPLSPKVTGSPEDGPQPSDRRLIVIKCGEGMENFTLDLLPEDFEQLPDLPSECVAHWLGGR